MEGDNPVLSRGLDEGDFGTRVEVMKIVLFFVFFFFLSRKRNKKRNNFFFHESGCLRMQPKVRGGKFHLKLNIGEKPIAHKYREGKMQSTLKREFNRT